MTLKALRIACTYREPAVLSRTSPRRGLGVAIGDFDNDVWPDVYVANDEAANFLFRNRGGRGFEEVGAESGTAYNESGVAEAGMGTDFADLNGDGHLDIIVTNLNNELNNVFMNTGDGVFEEKARSSGMGANSNSYVGFGARAFDYNNDGNLDVFVANGHITDNIVDIDPEAHYAQSDFLFIGDGKGKFREG
ncbi:MAG: VCBS repeat-containing protein [Planctomycetota bacterium]